MGWEPRRRIIRDGDAWVVETEPEWDEQEREWMLALAEWESTLCPSCGNPSDWCHDQARERDTTAQIERCFITDARVKVMDAYRNDMKRQGGQISREEALTTRIIPNIPNQ